MEKVIEKVEVIDICKYLYKTNAVEMYLTVGELQDISHIFVCADERRIDIYQNKRGSVSSWSFVDNEESRKFLSQYFDFKKAV